MSSSSESFTVRPERVMASESLQPTQTSHSPSPIQRGDPMTLIVRQLRSDVASFIFFGLVIVTTFLL